MLLGENTRTQPGRVLANLLRKDFKIEGTDCQTRGPKLYLYPSLCHQIETGVKRGHGEDDIIHAVIKAVKPGLPLRSYLKGRTELSLDQLKRLLRVHFREKEPTDLYAELTGTVQRRSESAMDFVIRAMDLRQRVLFASKANAVRYETQLVDKMFRRAVVTGLNSEAILSMVRPVLHGNTDEEILDALMAADIQEQERQQKQGAGPKRAQVMSVDMTADQ